MNLKKMERHLRVNLLGPGPRLMKKEFTGPRPHKGWETLPYSINWPVFITEKESVYCAVRTESSSIFQVRCRLWRFKNIGIRSWYATFMAEND